MRMNIASACIIFASASAIELTSQAGLTALTDDGQCCCMAMPCMPTCAQPCPDQSTAADDVDHLDGATLDGDVVNVGEMLDEATDGTVSEVLDEVQDALEANVSVADAEAIVEQLVEPVVEAEVEDAVLDDDTVEDLEDAVEEVTGEDVEVEGGAADPIETVTEIVDADTADQVTAQTEGAVEVEVVDVPDDAVVTVDPEDVQTHVTVEDDNGFPVFDVCVVDHDYENDSSTETTQAQTKSHSYVQRQLDAALI